MTHLRSAAALMIAACALMAPGGCGGSNGASTEKAAAAALLTLRDMPEGWSERARADDAEQNLNTEFERKLEDCSGRTREARSSGELATAASKDLTGPDDESLNTEATVFDSGAAAQTALEEAGTAFRTCEGAMVELARSAFTEGLGSSGLSAESLGLEITFNEQELAEAGDDQRGYRMLLSIPRLDLAFVLDFAFIRRGRVVGTLFYYGNKGDEPQRREIAMKFDAKLGAADEMLD